MLSLTEEELKSHQDAEVWYICGKRILNELSKTINYQEVRDHCHHIGKSRGTSDSICNLKSNVANVIPVDSHNGSNYDYHFIVKELANNFEEKFECLEENTEKYKTFSVQIEKEVIKIDKDGKFTNSARFMPTSLSNLVDNLTERIHKIKCKDWDCFLDMKLSRII